MELRQLRYFVALARELSFTRAAASLYISQSTLSQQIQNLEQELGCALFIRNSRKPQHSIALTEAGRRLLPTATRLVREAEQLPQALAGKQGMPGERRSVQLGLDLRIMYDSGLRRTIGDRLFGLKETSLSFESDFVLGEFDALRSDLRYGRLDIAFFLHQEPDIEPSDEIACNLMGSDELILAVRSAEPLEDTPETALALLSDRSVCLLNREGRGLYQAMKIFERLGVEPDIHLSTTREAMTLQVYAGQRIALLPEGWTREQNESEVQTIHLSVPEARLFRLVAWRRNAPEEIESLARSFAAKA